MPSPDSPVGMGLVEKCADAVLKLSDGDLVECSKFVVMVTCPVLRVMLELGTEIRDGKYVIPVADAGRRKYETFCKLIHGETDVPYMTFEELVDAYDCARRFGCTRDEKKLVARAWDLAPSPKHSSMVDHVPRILELGPDVVARVLETVAIELPLWVDFERQFLRPLALAGITAGNALDLMVLQHHYPPSAVAKWALEHLSRVAGGAGEDAVFRVGTGNSHLYVGDDTRAVYGEMLKLYDAHPEWDRRVATFARSVIASTSYNHHAAPGTRVEYENVRRTTVHAGILRPYRAKKCMLFAPFLRAGHDLGGRTFGFEVRQELLRPILGRSKFQVRVTVSHRASFLDPFYEAWHEFEPLEGRGWTLAPEPVARFHGGYGHLSYDGFIGTFFARFDFRYGRANAMAHPFDSMIVT